jgi:hypothetical protein
MRPANTNSNKMISISEIIKPAIAKPLGLLESPTHEKIRPRIHKIQPKTGIKLKKRARSQYKTSYSYSI